MHNKQDLYASHQSVKKFQPSSLLAREGRQKVSPSKIHSVHGSVGMNCKTYIFLNISSGLLYRFNIFRHIQQVCGGRIIINILYSSKSKNIVTPKFNFIVYSNKRGKQTMNRIQYSRYFGTSEI